MMKKYLVTTVFFLIFSLPSCHDEVFSPVPYAPVNLALDLRNEDIELNNLLVCKIFTVKRLEMDRLGFGGVLVVNGFGTDLNPVTLFAYDLACPVEVTANVRIVPDDKGNAVCPRCHAVYNIANGSGVPVSGSKSFLKAYRVSPQGNERYLVSN